ncbi:Hypothetical protein SRAE_2000200300 [Strongyloides ratti]|uniref:Uncharacterized protein n=1 Tax=Strongyloides ratti TaxID=34506 RepID=A0A090MYK4_STRRB|nr:Hypothetical protein SRAE_2000200300 [Strongyloides ratti]CEF67339.1 Hypothetical protein SRAE_2000200300 [Strongyloides ratti]
MAIPLSFISIDRSKFFKLKISTLVVPILLFSLLLNVYGDENESAIQTQLALRFHRAKELTPPSFMKRNWDDIYYDDKNIIEEQPIFKNFCLLDQYKYHILCRIYKDKITFEF